MSGIALPRSAVVVSISAYFAAVVVSMPAHVAVFLVSVV